MEFVLTTDASNKVIGSILLQGPVGKDLPISHYSRTLNRVEQNYSVTQLELLAIENSVKHFGAIPFGGKIVIMTDNKPLNF